MAQEMPQKRRKILNLFVFGAAVLVLVLVIAIFAFVNGTLFGASIPLAQEAANSAMTATPVP